MSAGRCSRTNLLRTGLSALLEILRRCATKFGAGTAPAQATPATSNATRLFSAPWRPGVLALNLASAVALTALLPATAHAQAGRPLWTNHYIGPRLYDNSPEAIVVDRAGNVIVTGESSGRLATVKYSNAGIPLWTNRFTNYNNCFVSGMAVDSSNGVIVTGQSDFNVSAKDCLTIKYSSAGVPLWTNIFNGPLNGDDGGRAVAVDRSNNIVVVGGLGGALAYNFGFLTLKYSNAGVLLWSNLMNLGTHYSSLAALVIDTNNDVIVTGNFVATNGYYDYATIKYSSGGVTLWTNVFDGPANADDSPRSIALDAANNIIVTGSSRRSRVLYGPDSGYVTIKYSSAGTPLWTNRFDGPTGDSTCGAQKVVVDSAGDVIVTGDLSSDYTPKICTTIKYSSGGVPLWTNSITVTNDTMATMVIDGRGNITVAGTGVRNDYQVIQYSGDGIPLWTNFYKFTNDLSKTDVPRALAVDAMNNVFVTGIARYAYQSSGYYATIKYAGIPPLVPYIDRQPLSHTNITGFTDTFSVIASGDPPLHYQWRKGGANLLNDGRISGVTTTNLVIANVQPADAGDYSVVVTNFTGSVTSSVAQLTIISPGRLSDVSYWPSLGFFFVFRDGTAGRPYRIQTCTSLTQGDWTDWVSFNYTGPIGLTDLGAIEATNRFYRAVSP